MASIAKYGSKWRARVRLKGVSQSRICETKHLAQAWALAQEQQLGAHGGLVMGQTLANAFDRYMREESPKKKGERWETVRLGKLKRDRLANIQLSQLSTEDLQNWVNRQTLAPGSIKRELTIIAAVLNVARKRWKWMSHDPMRDVDKPSDAQPRDRLLTDDERKSILEALDWHGEVVTQRHNVALIWLIALETAMRLGEIVGLSWDRLYLDKRYVRLDMTKNGTARDVPLSSEAVRLFGLCKQGDKPFVIGKDSVSVMFARAVELAGVENLKFHDSRHYAVTMLARKLNMLELSRMTGHRDPRALKGYYNETASEIAKKLG